MKLLAFYAAGLLMLCVMVFGGIEGFSFKIYIETGNGFSEITEFNTEQPNADHGLTAKHHELSVAKRSSRYKGQPHLSIDL
ncbi:MAG: hypothetical protein KAS73_06860 [Candidatus Sabulitectum sp.]|nr:hypothetical protein [Candidatus Sabulitectum sp.]